MRRAIGVGIAELCAAAHYSAVLFFSTLSKGHYEMLAGRSPRRGSFGIRRLVLARRLKGLVRSLQSLFNLNKQHLCLGIRRIAPR